jgi:hypothetical protein
MKIISQEVKSQDELNKQDLELTQLLKELWNAMRKDLYGAAVLPHEEIKFYQAGNKTKRALETWGKYRTILESDGISSLEDLSKIDVDAIARAHGIPRKELADIRSMAVRELNLIRELNQTA